MLAITALALTGLAARLVQIQGVDAARYASYGAQEVYQHITLPALRGDIYDRTGNLLAASSSRVDVVADDYLVSDPAAGLGRLATILRLSVGTLRSKLTERNGYVPLAYHVTGEVERKVEKLNLPYVSFVPDVVRTEPDGDLFSPLLGIVGFSGGGVTGRGLTGLEYLEDSLLAGSPGSEVLPTGPNGQGLPGPADDVVPARQGTSLVLTLDEPLQFEVTRDLARQIAATHATGGVAIVEDRRTGGILAMVDLAAGRHRHIGPSPQNLAATSIYEPGSVMKLVTIAGALEDRLITPSSVFTVPYQIWLGGWPFADADYHPTEPLTATQILAQSSNIGTIEIARRLGAEAPLVLSQGSRLRPAHGPGMAGRVRRSGTESERPRFVVGFLHGNGPDRYRRISDAASDPGCVQHRRERRQVHPTPADRSDDRTQRSRGRPAGPSGPASALLAHRRPAAPHARAGDRGWDRDCGPDPGLYRCRQDGNCTDSEQDRARVPAGRLEREHSSDSPQLKIQPSRPSCFSTIRISSTEVWRRRRSSPRSCATPCAISTSRPPAAKDRPRDCARLVLRERLHGRRL